MIAECAIHSFTISACIPRGFHAYSEIWNPEVKQNLNSLEEPKNMYDMYAVSTKNDDEILIFEIRAVLLIFIQWKEDLE